MGAAHLPLSPAWLSKTWLSSVLDQESLKLGQISLRAKEASG